MQNEQLKLTNIEEIYSFLIENKPNTDLAERIWQGLASTALLKVKDQEKIGKLYELAMEYDIMIPINNQIKNSKNGKTNEYDNFFSKRSE